MRSAVIAVLIFFAYYSSAQDSLKTVKLEEVVVTGQFEPQSLRQSVYQVRTINQDMIRARSATNIQGVLNTELGIRFSNDLVLGTSDVSIMGMSGQNVKILLDGVPMLDRGATRESLSQIDMNTVERIEIVEGPLSVLYGSDALAGVINIISRKGAKSGKAVSVQARMQEESAGDEYDAFTGGGTHNENVTVNWQGKKWYADAGTTRNNFGGLQGDKEGREKEWLPKDQWLATGTVGHVADNLNVWYRLNYLNEVLETPGAPNINTNIALDKEYRTDRFTHHLQAEWDISSKWNFNAMASFQDYSRRTLTSTYNVTTGERYLSPEPGTQDKSVFSSTTFRGTFLYRPTASISVQPGVDLNFNKGTGDRIDATRSIGDYAAFVSAELKPWPQVNIRPGARFIYNTVYDAPPVIPSVNVKISLTPALDLRAAYARGFRAPSLRELYFYFFDSSHSIRGNPDLKAEYSNSFTASLTWHAYNRSELSVNTTWGGFYNRFDNMITLGYDPENPGANTYINVAKYKTTGGTFTNSLRYKALNATAGFAYIGVHNEHVEADPDLPSLMWTPEANATVSYNVEKSGTTLSLFYKFTGTRSVYEYGEPDRYYLARREAFHWLDLTATQRIMKHIDLTLGIKNLLNVTRLQNTSLDVDGAHSTGGPVPMSYGRAFIAALNFHW